MLGGSGPRTKGIVSNTVAWRRLRTGTDEPRLAHQRPGRCWETKQHLCPAEAAGSPGSQQGLATAVGTQGHLRHARHRSGPRVSTHAAKLTSSEAPWGPQGVDQNGAGTGNGRKKLWKEGHERADQGGNGGASEEFRCD